MNAPLRRRVAVTLVACAAWGAAPACLSERAVAIDGEPGCGGLSCDASGAGGSKGLGSEASQPGGGAGAEETGVESLDSSAGAAGSPTGSASPDGAPLGAAGSPTGSASPDASPLGAGGTTGACAARKGAPGHVAPSCVKKALLGGAYMNLDQWAQRLGRTSLDIQTQWDNVNVADKANTVEQDWAWIDGHYSVDQWVVQAQWPGALSLAMPMWMRGQSPLLCASGENDEAMRRAISSLKSKVGGREVYVRLGWEFNADWYPTQTSEGDANYQRAWRDCWVRWWDVVKEVAPDYRVVWNPSWANSGACQSGYTSVLDLWPGAEFVDAAGPDQYDATWCGRPAAYDEQDGEQPIGIGAWVDWVVARGVPFAVPEWGIRNRSGGSGDRPQFIRDMYAAFKKAYESDSGLAYQAYFDGGSDYACQSSLLDAACNLNPNSSAQYFELFAVWPPR